MTAEIAVLNKFGISIAADSAVTVETFHDGEVKQKVYNSTNKIFALSKHAPIGLMFYNTVTLGGVLWETIVKSYRKKLDGKVFPILDDYYEDFLKYLTNNEKFLPIRLTPMTATCRVRPLSRVKLGIGWSRGVARDAEQ